MDALAKACPTCGRRYDTAATFCQKDGARLTMLGEEAPDPYIGTLLLDQFKIEEKIGSGGMGTVYRARQTTLHRDVAIKILHHELADNRDAVRRFKREARVCTALDHPNVVRVFLFGQLQDGSLYIVMEFLQGRPLLDLLARDGALPVHRALHIATQICDGVGEAHGHGIVHRDIKPENIVLVTKARDPDFVKVLDFGIARVLWGDEQTVATQSGLVFGTARYISPEGAAGEATDVRSDVYSLGVLTYQLLCGETPFDAPSPVAMLMKHIHTAPPHLRSRAAALHVPEPVADVVMRALVKNPEGRFEDANAYGEALRSAAEHAGFEVSSRRRSSISPSQPGVARVPPPSRGETSSVSPTPQMSLRTRESGTLTSAPSPFREDERVSIPGLVHAPKTGALRLVGVAFLIGALLVGAGFGISALVNMHSGDAPTIDIASLDARAHAALERGDYDAPHDSVLSLTGLMLQADPGNADALRLRRDASTRLSHRAQEQVDSHDHDGARATYRRALVFVPGDADIERSLAELDRAPVQHPPVASGLRALPDHVMEGHDFTLLATIDPHAQLDDRSEPRFVIKRADHSIGHPTPATLNDQGEYQATARIAHAGTYQIVFRTGHGEGHTELAMDLEVERDPTRARNDSEPPPVTTQGSWSPPVIAPAWTSTSPDQQQQQQQQAPPPPPPPWGVL